MDWFDRILAWGTERPDHVALVSGSEARHVRRVDQPRPRPCGSPLARAAGRWVPVAVVGHKEPEMVVGFLGRGAGRTPVRAH